MFINVIYLYLFNYFYKAIVGWVIVTYILYKYWGRKLGKMYINKIWQSWVYLVL